MDDAEKHAFTRHGLYLAQRSGLAEPGDRGRAVPLVGMKAAGLSVLPSSWTPPFSVVATAAFDRWSSSPTDRDALELEIANAITAEASPWQVDWPTGILIRSSAVEENLAKRGQNETVELPADYNVTAVGRAIQAIYYAFQASGADGSMALIVQARAKTHTRGHISNERRVSITENRWMYEVEHGEGAGGFNSQRARLTSTDAPLHLFAPARRALMARFREVGRWATRLGQAGST